MKRFLRYIAYRQLYKALRELMQSSNSSKSSSDSTQPTSSSQRQQQELLDHPGIPEIGSTVDSPAELKAVLQKMDPYEFEHFVADLWTRMGWETEVSSAANDQGVDVVARKSNPYDQLLLIQAKRYGPNTTVGSPDIQQYASLRHQFDDVDKVLLVTTNEYSRQARETADNLNVKLINGIELAQLIAEHEALDLVAGYLDFIEPIEVAEDEEKPADSINTKSARESDSPTATKPTSSQSGETAAAADSGAVQSTIWQKTIWAGLFGWFAITFGVNILSEGVWGLLFFFSWFSLPIAIFLDSRSLPADIEWPQYTWAYVIGSFIWFVSILVAGVYLWQRRSVSN